MFKNNELICVLSKINKLIQPMGVFENVWAAKNLAGLV
jgi:hypothetical protein